MRDWILLNPGPANTTPTVKQALVIPDLCHREPEFYRVMRQCREDLIRLAGAAPDFVAVTFTGSGTAAVEAVLCSVLPRDRVLLIVDNGVYGRRMVQIAEAHRIPTEVIRLDNVTPVAAADVEARLRARPEVSHVALLVMRSRASGGRSRRSRRPFRRVQWEISARDGLGW